MLATPQGPLPTGATEQQKQVPGQGGGELAIDYTTPRYEPAGFPIIGGDTDIGLQLGVAGSLTHFANGTRPYAWNLNLALSASFKNDNGFRLVQQNYIVTFDVPKVTTFFGHEVRFLPAAGYVRTIDAPYYGRGNATTSVVPAGVADPSTYYTFFSQMAYARGITRIVIRKPYEIFIEPRVRYMAPQAYPGSLLASDAAADGANGRPIVRGLQNEGIVSLAAGVIIDSRDNELFPTRGVFDQFGVIFDQGIASRNDVAYGNAGAVVGGYVPIGPLVLAMRGVVDFDVGNVPFFDLYTGGAYRILQLPGGATGVRGVPLGLYSGLIKAVANLELRAMSSSFHLLRQRIRLGGDVFVDAGRAFDDYSFDSPRDGRGIGVHWGTGAGFYVAWGDAALLRAEVAYSPDATLVAGLPIGIYVGDGVMF
jgi:Omp85 superfamily domain